MISEVSGVFSEWRRKIEADPAAWRSPELTCRWSVEGGGEWLLVSGNGARIEPYVSGAERPDCRISLPSSEFLLLSRGALNPQEAFLDGRLRLAGHLPAVLRLNLVLGKLVEQS